MRILYATQATGNGHLSRAREVIPHLQQYGEVDIFVSGTQADVSLPFEIKYQKYGLSFIFGKKGGVNIWKTIQRLKPLRLIQDTLNAPIKDYDIVLNDFEPITAWACKLKGQPCISLSHQGAFLSDKTPRPNRQPTFPEMILKHYAPTSNAIAFHFDNYDSFIHTPIIRSQIREAAISNKGHIAVYLPAVSDKRLFQHFSKIKSVQWKVFSKHTQQPYTLENIDFTPINNKGWIQAIASSEGVLMGAGFEGPSEALYLGKKLLVVPMKGQYEQQCNAEALRQMGVEVCGKITDYFSDVLENWLKHIQPLQVNYQDETAQIIKGIFV